MNLSIQLGFRSDAKALYIGGELFTSIPDWRNSMSIAIDIPTVNYHLWKPCNMRCGFCFATFEPTFPISTLQSVP